MTRYFEETSSEREREGVAHGHGAMVKARRRAWELGAYTSADYQAHKKGLGPKLFEAYTDDRKVLEKTARATALVRRTILSYAGFILGNAGTPIPIAAAEDDGGDEVEREVKALMRSADFAAWALPSMLTCLVDADAAIEPVRFPDGPDGPEEISVQVYGALEFDCVYPRSFRRMSTAKTTDYAGQHERVLTRESITSHTITIDEDGQRVVGDERVEIHNLGVNPLVHMRSLWLGDTVWSEWVGLAVEPLQRMMDAELAQFLAIATRTADPKMKFRGVAGQGDMTVGGHGKMILLPKPDMNAEYLELAQGGVLRDLREMIDALFELAGRIEPALAATQPGANTSAAAWQFRTMGLPQLVAMLRQNVGNAWKACLGRYRAMQLGEEYDPEWVASWRWQWPETRDQRPETVRVGAELQRDGVISKEEERALAREHGVLMPGYDVGDVPEPTDQSAPEETDQSGE